ncbi:ester cyclase [Hoeflea poritis]|uniref:Ester cyclase n=1 Tax=Hoeflea poritis TaxID=2993659 RepID=A0ABT4VR82_9HYPH|nr:ester cyclase [Hoeflea poritis]MDA4847199.1 ester cyclase [Hoeflea poritis]
MNTTPAQLIERFYHEVWNTGDEDVARQILHKDFVFRGSLGSERNGPEGFIDYLRAVRGSLPDFVCNIQEIVTEGHRAVARMEFVGTHGGTFYGVPQTGAKITWAGAAFFTTDGRQITELWVLGDIDAVKRQLGLQDGGDFSAG